MTLRNSPRWCCQGAEESDGIRFNRETGFFEFVLYINPLVWHRAFACPLCASELNRQVNNR